MMHLAFYPSHGKRKILLSTPSLVIIGMIAVTAGAWLDASAKLVVMPAKALQTQSNHRSQPVSLYPNQLQVERVTITPTGFDPGKIIRSRGQVILAIDNRSGLDKVWLRLDREGGERLVDVHVAREKLDWRGRVTLSPGRYRLTEGNHPDWLCVLTIPE